MRAQSLLLTALTLLPVAGVLSGCGQPFWLPPAHKIEVQQGNLVTQGQVDRLQIGMTRDEIVAITGEPVIGNTFNDNRWDYLYTRGPAGYLVKARSITVEFDNGVVSKLSDNFPQESGEIPIETYWWQRLLGRR